MSNELNISAEMDFDFESLVIYGHASAKNMHAAPAVKVHCSVPAKDKEGNIKEGQYTTGFLKFNNAALQMGLRDKPVFGFEDKKSGKFYLCEYVERLFAGKIPLERTKGINPTGKVPSTIMATSVAQFFDFKATIDKKSFTLSVGQPITTAQGWTVYALEMIDDVEDDDLEDDDNADTSAANTSAPKTAEEKSNKEDLF